MGFHGARFPRYGFPSPFSIHPVRAIMIRGIARPMTTNPPSEWGKFPLGKTVATRGALAQLTSDDILSALRRHIVGDWGELDRSDKAANENALAHEGRLFSVYRSASGIRFYVITEWDRSVTTVLLPHEY